MAFSHPVPELHEQLVDGRFGRALDDLLEVAYGKRTGVPAANSDYVSFEAQYIELFAVGHRGRPAVPLCAGEYIDLLDGKPRPALLLQYSRFYRHFGVRTRDRGDEGELPDHLTCQLQFMAWMTHLEAKAIAEQKNPDGYQRAQRDFLVKLMVNFCKGMGTRLEAECRQRGCDPLFVPLASALNDFLTQNRIELESVQGAHAQAVTEATATAPVAQNLWG
jgi:DMSO reductase family type II enzyme chaperone